MKNPINYDGLEQTVEVTSPFTNKPYLVNNRRLATARQQLEEYVPITYGKVQTPDGFLGEVGKYRHPADTGISDSDLLSWFNKGNESIADASSDWAKANTIYAQQIRNGAYGSSHNPLSELGETAKNISYDLALNSGTARVRAGKYLFKNGKQINSSDVGRGSGDHIDLHGAGKFKGVNPIQFADRFLGSNGKTLRSMIETGEYVPSAGQSFGAKRKGYSHQGIDIDTRVSELILNPRYPIDKVIPKHNPNGYGHYVQIQYKDGVTLGLGHMGKENVERLMNSFKVRR